MSVASLSAPIRDRRAAAPTPMNPRFALWAAMLGFFVVALDAQVVNVALPDIRTDLSANLSGLQWVVTGYTLMFTALLLFAGTLADRIGARRTYGIGMGVFVVASGLCGLAPSLGVLVAARMLQGVGAALVTPTSLALIRSAYLDSTDRAKAIALWAMGGAVAAAAGPLLGGALTQVGWRLIFFLNVPAGAAAFAVLARVRRSDRRAVPFDWTGQFSAIVALAALTFAVIEGGASGYGSPIILAAFGLAIAGAAVFLTAQVRGRHPIVPLSLLRSRRVGFALTAGFVGMVGFYGVVFLQSLYFQTERGQSPWQTGLLFLPMTALVAILNPVAVRTAVRFGRLPTIVGGLVTLAAGLTALAAAPVDTPTALVAAMMIPVGVGGSFTVPPIIALLIDSVPAPQAGTASGVLNTARQLGGALGVAVFGAIVGQAGFLPGLRISLLATAVLVLATAAAARLARSHGQ
ncbi:MFS transporter [Hamadaea tsunoensis]|uniref:MFS transporter n=1 Tax=Hamadaea tsunoensis TaxID=53368 RepID=UPI00048A3242|nr:MFS transporter [Hamadaea tsunoensis]